MELTKKIYDYSKLRGRIAEKMYTRKRYAEYLGISETSLRNKLMNRIPFKQDEILASMNQDSLDIKPEELVLYFFTLKVGENQTN